MCVKPWGLGFVMNSAMFFAGFACGGSAAIVYDSSFIALYNVVFTALPIIIIGIFEQDVDAGYANRSHVNRYWAKLYISVRVYIYIYIYICTHTYTKLGPILFTWLRLAYILTLG